MFRAVFCKELAIRFSVAHSLHPIPRLAESLGTEPCETTCASATRTRCTRTPPIRSPTGLDRLFPVLCQDLRRDHLRRGRHKNMSDSTNTRSTADEPVNESTDADGGRDGTLLDGPPSGDSANLDSSHDTAHDSHPVTVQGDSGGNVSATNEERRRRLLAAQKRMIALLNKRVKVPPLSQEAQIKLVLSRLEPLVSQRPSWLQYASSARPALVLPPMRLH